MTLEQDEHIPVLVPSVSLSSSSPVSELIGTAMAEVSYALH